MATTLRQLEALRSSTLREVEQEFVTPMETFLRVDFKALADVEKRLSKAREDYDEAQIKHEQLRKVRAYTHIDIGACVSLCVYPHSVPRACLQKKGVTAAKLDKAQRDVNDARRTFELTDMNYLNKLLELESKQQFEINERLCKVMHSHMVAVKLQCVQCGWCRTHSTLTTAAL